jgi:hypothetical protein
MEDRVIQIPLLLESIAESALGAGVIWIDDQCVPKFGYCVVQSAELSKGLPKIAASIPQLWRAKEHAAELRRGFLKFALHREDGAKIEPRFDCVSGERQHALILRRRIVQSLHCLERHAKVVVRVGIVSLQSHGLLVLRGRVRRATQCEERIAHAIAVLGSAAVQVEGFANEVERLLVASILSRNDAEYMKAVRVTRVFADNHAKSAFRRGQLTGRQLSLSLS